MEQAPTETKKARSSESSPQAHADGALDDASLHAILYCMPLRDAAVTTALSRRWRRVFPTLPCLYIDSATFNGRDYVADSLGDDYCEDPDRWVEALDCIVGSRAAPVAVFDVEADVMFTEEGWFHDVIRVLCRSGGLLKLRIWNTRLTSCYLLPSPVYACETLVSLELFSCRLRVPDRLTGLRALQSLVLQDVVATDGDLQRMLSRCEAMKRLVMEDIRKARNIVIDAPSLEYLQIHSYRPLRVSVKAPKLRLARLSLCYGCAELSWSFHDNEETDGDYSIAEIQEMFDFVAMEKKEHKRTDEIRNMVTFFCGIRAAKELRLDLPREYSKVLSKTKIAVPRMLPKKCCLLGLQKLTLALDHNHEALARLVSCLLNSSPNLKDLEIMDPFDIRYSGHLAAEFWEKHITADCIQNHLSVITFYMRESLFGGYPRIGLCQFLVMNARALKRMSIKYHRSLYKTEHVATVLEAVQSELRLWPRASPDMQLELSEIDCIPSI
ncbi:putative F-box protein At3g44060 [Oryza glaberrima]|uniref:putative F-box protein At3g44060 n=1 Tax=Oryza glaberrima TaxID=4538 RepID=UPI00224C0836|nr:putative F-box protein At3g44060 [Oryza glaberrima]